MANAPGKLYVVATPIGNLADISYRAVETLKQVDLIAAEDTRHVQMLLKHYGISNKLLAMHQHNEDQAAEGLLNRLQAGQNIALVSDAGTPLVSDPGLPLVKQAKEAGFTVIPIPGACALIAALSAAGLPALPFSFLGFSPRNSSARITFFTEHANSHATWIFYESSHRIQASLEDLASVLPPGHEIALAREITKHHETIIKAPISDALDLVRTDDNMRKGEFVVIVAPAAAVDHDVAVTPEQEKILSILLTECSVKTASALAAEITGARKKTLYQAALAMANAADN